jgi:hypothetical protein
MQQQPGTGQMAQKLDAQARAFGRAFDQSRNIGHHEAFQRPDPHHAQIGMQGGEGIVGDLGPSGGHGADQGGFAGVRHPQQPDIGDDFQFQPQIARLARRSRLGLARGAIGAAFVAGVAETVKAAARHQQPLARLRPDRRSVRRYRHHGPVVPTGTTMVRSAPLRPVQLAPIPFWPRSARKPPGKAVIGQGIQFGVGLQVDAAAIAAIAAIGAAEGDVFLPPEADATVAAVAGLDPDDDFIDEFHGVLRTVDKRKAPNGAFDSRPGCTAHCAG